MLDLTFSKEMHHMYERLITDFAEVDPPSETRTASSYYAQLRTERIIWHSGCGSLSDELAGLIFEIGINAIHRCNELKSL